MQIGFIPDGAVAYGVPVKVIKPIQEEDWMKTPLAINGLTINGGKVIKKHQFEPVQ